MRPTPRETRTEVNYTEMATGRGGRGKKSSPKGNDATRSGPDPRTNEAPPANTAVEPVTEALPLQGPETRALQDGHDSLMPNSRLPSIPSLPSLQLDQKPSVEIIASSTQEDEERIALQRVSQGPLTGEQDENASLSQNGQLEPNGLEAPAPPSSTSSDKVASTISSGTKKQKLKLNGPKPQRLRLTPPKKPIQSGTPTEPRTGDKEAPKSLQQRLRDLRKKVMKYKPRFGDQQDLYRKFLTTLRALQDIEHESDDTLKARNPSRISWLRGLVPSELQRTLPSVIEDVQEVKDRFGDRPELGDQLLDFLNGLQNLDDELQSPLEKNHAERMRLLDALCSETVSQEGAEGIATGSAPTVPPPTKEGKKRRIDKVVDAAADTVEPPRGKRKELNPKEKTNETSDVSPPRLLEVGGPSIGIVSSSPGVLSDSASPAQHLKSNQKGNNKGKKRTAKTPTSGPAAAILADPPLIQPSNCEEQLGGESKKRKADDTFHDGEEPLLEQPQRKRAKRSPKAGLQTNNTSASGPSAVTGDDIATAPSPQALADSPAIHQASAAQAVKKETKKRERKPTAKARKEIILKLPQGQDTKRKVDDTIRDGDEPLPEQPQRKRVKRGPKAGLQANNIPASGPSAVTGDDIATAPSPQTLAGSPVINKASAAQAVKKEAKKQERKLTAKAGKELILKLPQGKKTKVNVNNAAAIAPSKLANASSTDAEKAEIHAAASVLTSMGNAGPIYVKHREWSNPAPVIEDGDSTSVIKGKNSTPVVKGRKPKRVIKGKKHWDEHAITDPDLLKACPSLEFLNAPPPKDEYRPTYHKNCDFDHTTCKSYPPRQNNRRGTTINKVSGQVVPEAEVFFTTSPVPRLELNPKETKSGKKAVEKMITAGVDTDKNYPPYVKEPVQDNPFAAPPEMATEIPSDAIQQPHVEPTESDEEAARDMQQLTGIIADIHRSMWHEEEELHRRKESRSKVEAWLPSVE